MTTNIIKINCDFDFYFNKTDVTPTVLDGGDEIVLANWPNDKHIICNVNNDIPIKIPSHPYVLVNRSVLCNCGIEADNHHLLESRTRYDQTLPLNLSKFDSSLRHAPTKLKDFMHDYVNNKEIFDLQQRHAVESFKPSKNFFSSYIVNIFTFTSSIL